jgi:translocation and assembly module TamB
MDGQTPRKSFKKRLFRVFGIFFILMIVLTAALPWILSTPPAKVAMVKLANRTLAPARIGVDTLSLSWFGSIRLTGLTLVDAREKTLIDAREATLDRGLVALGMNSSKLGTLTLTEARVDIERRPDGLIDLVEALIPTKPAPINVKPTQPSNSPKPATDLTLRIVHGSLLLKSPELAEPLSAENMEMEVRVPAAAGEKLSWKIRLSRPPGGSDSETLGIDGVLDYRAESPADLTMTLKGEQWPLAARPAAGLLTRGLFDGTATVSRTSGAWSASGDAKWLEVDAAGPLLQGDRLALDKLALGFDVRQAGPGWDVRRLSLASPIVTLNASGSVGSDGDAPAADVDGTVYLAVLAKQLPHAMHLREGLTLEKGSARLKLKLKTESGVQTASIDAGLSDLVARDSTKTFTLRDPASLTGKGSRHASTFSLEALDLKTGFLELKASGDLEKGVNLTGSLDLAQLQSQFRELIDFGQLSLAGKGLMAGDYRKTSKGFLARYALNVNGLNVAGITTSPIVRDSVRFDASANGPSANDGLPASFENVLANLKSSQDNVKVALATREGVTSISAVGSVPVSLNAHDGRLDARLVGRWTPNVRRVDLDELRVDLNPLDASLARTVSLALGVKGKVDLASEDLTLTAIDTGKGKGLIVGPDGIKIHGFQNVPWGERTASVVLIADTYVLDQALAYWQGMEPKNLGGGLTAYLVMAPAATKGGALQLSGNVLAPSLVRIDPKAKSRTLEPIAASFVGIYDPQQDLLSTEVIRLVTRYATLDAKGTISELTSKRVAALQGSLAPDWKSLSTILAASTAPGATLTGGPRPFHVKGPLSGDSFASILKGLDAEIGIDLKSAETFGMNLGPAPIVVRASGGATSIDPIRTTLNNGKVDLKPTLAVDPVQGIALQLLPNSTIDGAEINDEVSKQVLRYIAPVLDNATHVRGKVSVAISQADIPITGPPSHTMTMTGDASFQDVVFAPGKLASEIFTLAGKPDEPGLKMDQPIHLAIANNRVIQKGLEIPIRRDAKIAIDGSVGFDQTLDLRATVPISPKMLGKVSGLDGLVKDRSVIVPIIGTVSQPKLNRKAFEVALKGLGGDVLKEKLGGVLNQIAPPAEGEGGKPSESAGNDLKDLEKRFKGLLPRR